MIRHRILRRPRFLLVDGCPVPYAVAAQVWLVTRLARQTVSSAYRGQDAAALLHAHGKRTQAEIHADPAYAAISNPAGRSMHELRSDGVAKRGPVGRPLADWEVGIDSGGNDDASKHAVEAAARAFGWTAFHPYSRGVEGHHWGFMRRPRATSPGQAAHLIRIRRRLPRK